MFIAMNNFRVNPELTSAFEQAWRDRESFLAATPGFRSFHLLRGPRDQEAQLYASHTVWDDEATFRAWTESDAFRKAHAGGGKTAAMLLGPPKFVGWHEVPMQQP